MRKILNILFITLFIFFTYASLNSIAQAASAMDNPPKTTSKDGGPDALANNARPDDDVSKKSKIDANKKGQVKQVKSARPDMSKSRGARPPDIVRPSGSRIPKGVGRPAGSAIHGR